MESIHVIGISQAVVGFALLSVGLTTLVVRKKRGDYTEIIVSLLISGIVNLAIGIALIN
jgi:hypothetical protein